ncbi:hypothetical protein FC1_25510 [Flavobacterium columnare NBRC 100251 = ATCC 23463]|nr:hypothetical protein FC1_25510 [Flavobacterium columnare NBRC 100251 = ATCC 23463]
MIKYFKQQNWENLKAYININDKGELFTGIKEKLDLNKNIYFRISYVNNFEHGLIYDFCFREYTWYIYIYIYIYIYMV